MSSTRVDWGEGNLEQERPNIVAIQLAHLPGQPLEQGPFGFKEWIQICRCEGHAVHSVSISTVVLLEQGGFSFYAKLP